MKTECQTWREGSPPLAGRASATIMPGSYGPAPRRKHSRAGRSAVESVPAADGELPAAGTDDDLEPATRREPADDRCAGAEGPGVLRAVRAPGDWLSRGRA